MSIAATSMFLPYLFDDLRKCVLTVWAQIGGRAAKKCLRHRSPSLTQTRTIGHVKEEAERNQSGYYKKNLHRVCA